MQSIRLIQFSDLHLFADPEATLRGVATLPALQAVISNAHRRCHEPDAVLLTGDLVQDDPGGYHWVRQIFGNSRVPVLCLAGNHDLLEPMHAHLNAPPFVLQPTARLGDWLIVLLNSSTPNCASGRLGEAQLAQLDALLRQHPALHVLICMHHHPIAMRSEWLDNVGLEDAEAFHAIIDRHANVRGVLWGHVHQAVDCFRSGVRFMATPATCAQFKPGSDEFAIDSRPPGYRVLELMPDGAIATEVCWLESYAQRSVA